MNSIIFSLGNKPSHGIYLSTGLFLAAIVASCLAMLNCLIAVLWQAFNRKDGPIKHAAHIAIGSMVTSRSSAANADGTAAAQVHKDSGSVSKLVQLYHASGSAPLGGDGVT